jgi:Uma2 family endonuclease
MAADPARKLATYEDVLSAPPNMIAEIIYGSLELQSRPAGPHTRITSGLGIELGGPFDRGRGGPGGWLILDEPELHLGANVLVPDLAAWRRERLPEIPNDAFFTVVPDWICEVLSPRTALRDRGPKLEIYAEHGVKHAWLIDPATRMLEVYRLEGGKWLRLGVHSGDEAVRAEPFDAVPLELANLWDGLPPVDDGR